eukprot:4397386-Ditylum_brightwellii.AAC.2
MKKNTKGEDYKEGRKEEVRDKQHYPMNQRHQTTSHQMIEQMKARPTSLTFHQLCFQMKLAHPNKEYTAYAPDVQDPITLNMPELKEMRNKNRRDR